MPSPASVNKILLLDDEIDNTEYVNTDLINMWTGNDVFRARQLHDDNE